MTNGAVTLGAGYQMIKRSGEKVETINAEPTVADWCEKPWHVVQDSVKNTCRHWIDTVPQNLKPETSVDDNLKTDHSLQHVLTVKKNQNPNLFPALKKHSQKLLNYCII